MKKEKYEMLDFFIENYWNIDIVKGEVRSRKFPDRKLGSDAQGYVQIGTSLNGKRYTYYAHQIIAHVAGLDVLNFEINHIDGNKKNNSIQNLEAVTHKENIRHIFENGFHNTLKGVANNAYGLEYNQIEIIKNRIEELKFEQAKAYNHLIKSIADEYQVPLNTVKRIGKAKVS